MMATRSDRATPYCPSAKKASRLTGSSCRRKRCKSLRQSARRAAQRTWPSAPAGRRQDRQAARACAPSVSAVVQYLALPSSSCCQLPSPPVTEMSSSRSIPSITVRRTASYDSGRRWSHKPVLSVIKDHRPSPSASYKAQGSDARCSLLNIRASRSNSCPTALTLVKRSANGPFFQRSPGRLLCWVSAHTQLCQPPPFVAQLSRGY